MAHSGLDQPARGFLANVTTIPPLIYPFQYNPSQVRETKRLEWAAKYEEGKAGPRGAEGVIAGLGANLTKAQKLATATSVLGRAFSAAEIKRFAKEQPREIRFSFVVDGREQRPGEPSRRRNDAGDIVADLAIVRSFAYPQVANWLDLAGETFGSTSGGRTADLWFNEPPTMTLRLGGMSFEGFVEELTITETQFNADLDPTRAEIEISLLEKIDSISFILESIKRIARTSYYTSYEDVLNALF